MTSRIVPYSEPNRNTRCTTLAGRRNSHLKGHTPRRPRQIAKKWANCCSGRWSLPTSLRLSGTPPTFPEQGSQVQIYVWRNSLPWRATRRRGRKGQWIINRHVGGRDGARPSNFHVVSSPILEGSALSWPSQTTENWTNCGSGRACL